MNNNETDQLGLDNLEFFENFASDDPLLDDASSYDPNANLAPDILGKGELELEEEDLPKKGVTNVKPTSTAETTTSTEIEEEDLPLPNEAEAEDNSADDLSDDDDSDELNYYEAFGKGLLRSGHLDAGEEINPDEIEWTEQSFLDLMDVTVQNKAWKQLEDIAVEAYGQEGIELVKDLFINKVPVNQYLSKYNEQISLENVDLTNANNQELIFKEYLTRTGLDEDEVEEQLDYAIKTGKLETYSEKYYAKLLDRTRQEREVLAEQSAQRTREIQERENTRNESYIQTLEQAIKAGEISGYPINQNEASNLFNFVTDRSFQLPNGQKISEFEYNLAKMRQEDPQKFLAVARLVQADLDLTPVKKKGVSEETNSIFKELQNKSKRGQKIAPKKETQMFSSYFGR